MIFRDDDDDDNDETQQFLFIAAWFCIIKLFIIHFLTPHTHWSGWDTDVGACVKILALIFE